MRGGGENEVSGGRGKSGGMDGWMGDQALHTIYVLCVRWVDPGIKAPTSYSAVHTCFSGLLYPGSSLWILMSKRIQPLLPVGQACSAKIELVPQVKNSGGGWFNETHILTSKNRHGVLNCFLFSALCARFMGQFTSI